MKTAELKAGTAYATCNGEYIVPVEPVHAKYQYLFVPTQEDPSRHTRTVVDTTASDDPENPWGKCHRTDPQGSFRGGKPGVKVLAYTVVDGEGNPVGEPVEGVVPPRDIGGTWLEYMSLYAHVVRSKWQERERNRLVDETSEELKAILEGTGFEVEWHRGWRDEPYSWRFKRKVYAGDGSEPEHHQRAIGLAAILSDVLGGDS